MSLRPALASQASGQSKTAGQPCGDGCPVAYGNGRAATGSGSVRSRMVGQKATIRVIRRRLGSPVGTQPRPGICRAVAQATVRARAAVRRRAPGHEWCVVLVLMRGGGGTRTTPCKELAVEHEQPVGVRQCRPATLRQACRADGLVSDEGGPTDATRQVERTAHDRIAHAGAPLVVRVKVQLVARAVRPAVRPPFSTLGVGGVREGRAHVRVQHSQHPVKTTARRLVEVVHI